MFRNQILGIIRFSMPALGGFQLTPSDLAGCEARVYDPIRLRARMDLFRKFCLPTLQNQTDQGFMALILVGRNLPAPFRTELDDMTADCEPIKVVKVDPDRQAKMITQALAAIPEKRFTHRTTFRLDDDDMLDMDYIARLRLMCWKVHRLSPLKPYAVAMNRGYYVDLSGDEPRFYEKRETSPLGLGLSLTAPIHWATHSFMVNHRHFAGHYNTYSCVDEANFLRTMHDTNDGHRAVGKSDVPIEEKKMRRILKTRFGVSWDDLAANTQTGATDGVE